MSKFALVLSFLSDWLSTYSSTMCSRNTLSHFNLIVALKGTLPCELYAPIVSGEWGHMSSAGEWICSSLCLLESGTWHGIGVQGCLPSMSWCHVWAMQGQRWLSTLLICQCHTGVVWGWVDSILIFNYNESYLSQRKQVHFCVNL